MTHDFNSSLDIGLLAEQELDACFGRVYTLEKQTLETDKTGIDRVLVLADGRRISLQYKADFQAAKHMNAFIEVVSVDTVGTPGWVFTCQASHLVYWVPPLDHDRLYNCVIVKLSKLRPHVGSWMGQYQIKPAWNRMYRTWGICVPWALFEDLGMHRFDLKPSEELLTAWDAQNKRIEVEA